MFLGFSVEMSCNLMNEITRSKEQYLLSNNHNSCFDLHFIISSIMNYRFGTQGFIHDALSEILALLATSI